MTDDESLDGYCGADPKAARKVLERKEPQCPCAICHRLCEWVPAYEDAPHPFGGWYCKSCDVFTETDVEVED